MGHPNSKKHKAMHGGYRERPGTKQINALMGLYSAIGTTTTTIAKKEEPGVQLKLRF